MCKAVEYCVKNARSFYVVGGIILAIAGWFFMMNGIPARVDKLEMEVAELKASMTKQETKSDLMLQALYEIRAVILKK